MKVTVKSFDTSGKRVTEVREGGYLIERVEIPLVNTCGCGRSYTRPEWDALPLLGQQHTDEAGIHYLTELRNCECDSTLGIERVVMPP